jgi:hypothetical protein
MVFGVLGPLLILYHCNFSLGSLNSSIALICTLLVAVSGLVGRYLHAKIYSDLDGHRKSLAELTERARITSQQKRHVSVLAPDLLTRMGQFDAAVMSQPDGLFGAVLLPAKLAITTRFGQWQLCRYARRQIALRARGSEAIRAQKRRLQRVTSRFIVDHMRRVRRVAELSSWERIFSLWHVFHLPFFYMLVLTALTHVVAVHMY